jgi:hypothetical protein
MRNKANLLRGHGRPLPRPPALTPGLPNAIHRVWGPLPPAGRLRGRLCKTNPISGGAGWDEAPGPWDTGQTCKTNPIWLVGGGSGGRNARNEPNFRRPRYPLFPYSTVPAFQSDADRAKRSQFRRGRMGRDGGSGTRGEHAKRTQFGWPAAAPEGAMRKTNPICRVGWGPGDGNVRNEPNFRPSGGPDGPGIRHRMPAPPHGSGHRTIPLPGPRSWSKLPIGSGRR